MRSIRELWRLRTFRALLAASLGVAGVGCSDLLTPFLPDDRVPLSPIPVDYERWWSIVETCSGLQADLEDVEWWVVTGQETLPGTDAVGRYYRLGHQVGLVERVARDGFVVRHEMLHAVLSSNRIGGDHPKSFFENRCGGVVTCSRNCREDVGGPPTDATSLPVVEGEDVHVTVELAPRVISKAGSGDSCHTIIVGAEYNGTEDAVMDLSPALVFGWELEGWGGGSGGVPTPPNDLVVLPPGTTRWQVYDCPLPLAHLEPGDYVVRGVWENNRSAGVEATIIP